MKFGKIQPLEKDVKGEILAFLNRYQNANYFNVLSSKSKNLSMLLT